MAKPPPPNPHLGSTLDRFLEEEKRRTERERLAIEEVKAWLAQPASPLKS